MARKRRSNRLNPRIEALERYLLLAGPPAPLVYQASGANHSPATPQILPLPTPFPLPDGSTYQEVQVVGGHTYLSTTPPDVGSHTGYYSIPVTAGERVAVEFETDNPTANLAGWQIGTYWGMSGTLKFGNYDQVANGNLISLIALNQTNPGRYTSDNVFTAPSTGNVILFTNEFYYVNDPVLGPARNFGFKYDFTYSYSIIVTNPTPPPPPPPVASVKLTDLSWNIDRNGTAANADLRGVDFNYAVNGSIPKGLTIPIAFYWATGTDPNTIVCPVCSNGQTALDTVNIVQTPGIHGYGTSDPVIPGNDPGRVPGNDPARWGTPPPNAKFVMAIIDPENSLGEGNDYSGRVLTKALPSSPSDVLEGSVHAHVENGYQIAAEFDPGSGVNKPIPLSEAEVYLGVDHFNWIQNIIANPLSVNDYVVKDYDYSKPLVATATGIKYQAADGTQDDSMPLAQSPALPPLQDPIVQNGTDNPHKLTYVSVIDEKYLTVTYTNSDQYPYYDDENHNTFMMIFNGKSINIVPQIEQDTYAGKLMFFDAPGYDYHHSPFHTVADATGFETQLVGIKYDKSKYDQYTGINVNFVWSSNTLYDFGKYMGGGVSEPVLFASASDYPPAVGGGVFGVRLTDHPIVTSAPPNLAFVRDQSVKLGGTLTIPFHDPGFSSFKDTTKYSLSPNTPAGASIDAESGLFTFVPRSAGIFPLSVIATNQDGAKREMALTINVLPVGTPSPPTVSAGSKGNTAAGTPFTGYGSFLDSSDPGPFTAKVNYGDGSPVQPLPLNSDNTFNFSHVYSTTGSYAVTVSVADANGLTGSSQFSVTVAQPSSGIGPVPPPLTPPVVAPTSPSPPTSPTSSTNPPAFNPLALGPIELGRYYLVTSLYQTILQRSPDEPGLFYWIAKLAEGDTPMRVTQAFFKSSEYRLSHHQHKPSNAAVRTASDWAEIAGRRAAIVSTNYRVILSRDPDATGYHFWVNQLAKGTSILKEATSFYRSKEYHQLHIGKPVPKSPVGTAVRDAKRNAKIVAS